MIEYKTLINGKPTIALLLGTLSSHFHESILRGAEDAAKRLGLNLIGYACGPLNSPDPMALDRTTLFDLPDLDQIDGLIIPVSSHTRYINTEEQKEFLNKYNTIPLVNIGSKLDGYTSIIADFSVGLNAIVKHFKEVHGYKRIAYIRGPRNHETSNNRTEIFKKALLDNNLEIYEDLIFYNDLNKYFVQDVADQIINSDGSLICDAIISINDKPAIGLIEELVSRGFNIPEDIAISGSMNIDACLFSEPPLTSINEPKYELGYKAVEVLYGLINNKDVPQLIEIPTTLNIRNSCGCRENFKQKKVIPKEIDFNDSVKKLQQDLKEILQKYRLTDDTDILTSLTGLYKQSMEQFDFYEFLKQLQFQLNNKIKSIDILPWIKIVSKFSDTTLAYLNSSENTETIMNFISTLSVLKNDIEEKSIRFNNFDRENHINYFREIANYLNSSFDLDSITQFTLKLLDISNFSLSVFNMNDGNIISATNYTTIRNRKKIEIPSEGKIFNPKQLVPSRTPQFKDRYTQVVLPLSFRKKPLGFIVLDLGRKDGTTYENMQATISTALKNELQIKELTKAEERFSDIAHSTSNWLWETDKNLNFIYNSESVFNVIGYRPEEILQCNMLEVTISENNLCSELLKENRKINNLESICKHRNGNLVYLLVSAKPIIKDNIFTGYRGVIKDITEQKLQEKKINHLAYTDILTGLPNRAKFQEKLEETIKKSQRCNKKFALMFLDLDRFKYINDSLGHDAGDLLLKSVTKVLKESSRSSDTIARLGGDEFTIILSNITSDKEIIKVAKRIVNDLAKPFVLNGKQIFVTASLGISIYPHDGEESVTLLKNSDNAMYKAKSLGRNRYVFYDKKLEILNVQRIHNEELLHQALNKNHFILHYQPQVKTESGKILGMEALVRIYNPDHGLINPGEFIPLAEDLGLIGKIDLIVLSEACRQYKEWMNKGYGAKRISINLSAIQLRNKQITSVYTDIINQYGINPSNIQFEITEHTLIENEEIALQILNELKSYGFSIALDDFGTGYSSLSCINLYPIDTVKIDRTFVKNSVQNEKNRAIINAIVHLARSLDLKIVAEGVETKEQYELIKSLKCDEIQGYYFYKPYQAADIETYF